MKGSILSKFSVLVVAGLFPALLFAYQNPGQPQGYINDFAGILKQDEKVGLETKLDAFTKATGNEISVVTVKSLGDDTVENFAVELFKEWGIGKKGQDNGVLVLIALDDREMRIEVGYGLEGSLTDSQSGGIIRNVMTPAFRANDFFGGIDGAVNQIISDISPEYATGVGLPQNDFVENTSSSNWNFSNLAFFIFFIPIWIASILARSKSWWAGGVVGGVIGVVVGLFFGFFYLGIIAMVFMIPAGLLLDFVVSRAYSKSVGNGIKPPWWIGGGGHGGGFGGGFGGFGGGFSGGGGASGRW